MRIFLLCLLVLGLGGCADGSIKRQYNSVQETLNVAAYNTRGAVFIRSQGARVENQQYFKVIEITQREYEDF